MPIGVTRGISTWRQQQSSVERFTDNAAYTAAHPDSTLVLAGPSRSDIARADDVTSTSVSSLLAVGMLQSFSISMSKPTTPVMAIGSGRSFFVSGKSQGQIQIQRLFVTGRNLARALYHNARTQNLRVDLFDDPAALSADASFYTNMDSELYLVPFGMGILYQTKLRAPIAGQYLELCMLNSMSVGLQAGGTMIAETATAMFDRSMPFTAEDVLTGNVSTATVNAVLGIQDTLDQDVATEQMTTGGVISLV